MNAPVPSLDFWRKWYLELTRAQPDVLYDDGASIDYNKVEIGIDLVAHELGHAILSGWLDYIKANNMTLDWLTTEEISAHIDFTYETAFSQNRHEAKTAALSVRIAKLFGFDNEAHCEQSMLDNLRLGVTKGSKDWAAMSLKATEQFKAYLTSPVLNKAEKRILQMIAERVHSLPA